jgi:hypothetical protein
MQINPQFNRSQALLHDCFLNKILLINLALRAHLSYSAKIYKDNVRKCEPRKKCARKKIKEKEENANFKKQNYGYCDCYISDANYCFYTRCFANC